jgi:hypothetical protein
MNLERTEFKAKKQVIWICKLEEWLYPAYEVKGWGSLIL